MIEHNTIEMAAPDVAASYPAIALDRGAVRNLVAGNTFTGRALGYVVWDSNACGVNTWRDNVFQVKPAGGPIGSFTLHSGNRSCLA